MLVAVSRDQARFRYSVRIGEPEVMCELAPPPLTPAISEALVTRPFMAQDTAARSQPPDTSRVLVCPGGREGVCGRDRVLEGAVRSLLPTRAARAPDSVTGPWLAEHLGLPEARQPDRTRTTR
jgi:hypothetical protein